MKLRVGFSFVILLVVMILATDVYGSRARLRALGQDTNGSLFVNDDRNIFLNPAFLDFVPNRLNLEAGFEDAYNMTTATSSTPKAEGGLSYKLLNFSVAAQLGRISDETQRIISQDALAAGTFFDPQNSLDLIVAGGGSMKWGGMIHYANSKDNQGSVNQPDREAKDISFRGGILHDLYQAYAHLGVIHDSQVKSYGPDQTKKYEGDLSLEVGGSFNLTESGRLGAFYKQTGFGFDDGAATKGEQKSQVIQVLYFQRLQQGQSAFAFGSAGLQHQSKTTDFEAAASSDRKNKSLSVPVTLGFEAGMTDWLALRGAVTQKVLIHQEEMTDNSADYNRDNIDSTNVRLGSTIRFDQFALDATLEGETSGKINANSLMANLGVTYDF